MHLNTVLFDMDGLLIDSEPLWNEAANEVFSSYGMQLTDAQYKSSTGLRTKEFVEWWFNAFGINNNENADAIAAINGTVVEKIRLHAEPMPGIETIFSLFKNLDFKIGIASSSPKELIELVINQFGLQQYVQAIASAQHLSFGKPHPQVYLDCATALQANALECICFEDSFNGMIAAKAARMKCVVVPHFSELEERKWGGADLKISSLENFDIENLKLLYF